MDISSWVRVATKLLSHWVKLLVLQEVVLCLEKNCRSCQDEFKGAVQSCAEEPTVRSPCTKDGVAPVEKYGNYSPGRVGQGQVSQEKTVAKGHTLSARCSLPKDSAEGSPAHSEQLRLKRLWLHHT